MAPPNINVPGRSIPPGYLIGRSSPGTGPQELLSIADVGRQLVALNIVPAPGAPAASISIANNRVLGNTSGATAAASAQALTQPAAGLTITGGTNAFTFALANDLAALEGLSSTGLAARTTTDTWAQRSLAAPAAGFTITNPAGVAGDPTFVLANDLAALEAMSGTGLVARTASETYAQRTITGTASRISLTNGSGVSGNPTIDIDVAYVGQTSITTLGTVATATWQATKIGLAYGGTNADLSATGGANQFLKQSSVGAAITVGQPTFADIGSGVTAATATGLTISGGTLTGTTTLPNTGQLDSSGHLGLGKVPTYYLDVMGTVRFGGASGDAIALNNGAASNAYFYFDSTLIFAKNGVGDKLTLADNGEVQVNSGFALSGYSSGTCIYDLLRGGASGNGLDVEAWDDIAFKPGAFGTIGAGTRRLIITSGGIIGIGGVTAASPALKKSSTTLQVRLGDDSGYTNIDVLAVLDQGTSPTGTAASGYVRARSPTVTAMGINLVQSTNETIAANCGMVVPRTYTIAAGVSLTMGVGAILEII